MQALVKGFGGSIVGELPRKPVIALEMAFEGFDLGMSRKR